jgi:hypothetical protein
MPNSLTANGLTTATQAELVASYTAAFQSLYGADINLGAETPDGQLLLIFIQSVLDQEDLLTQIYNTFNPDNAIGTILDQRVAINGIQRQAGTYTVTDITLTLSQSVNLYGLDQSAQSVYTVADNAGNQWQLQFTQLGASPGTLVTSFQSATPGALTTVPNTITVPVTIVLGVQSINNPTTYTTLGVNEETDAALRIRRQKSVSLPSQGYLAGLLAALENINGVTYAFVEENDTGSTNGDGVPGHSIWVIVAGSGAAADIAQAIYTKRNAGCGMYNSGDAGAQSYNITQADGSIFTIYWDAVITEDLFIKFTVTSLDGSTPPNIPAILSSLPTSFAPGVAQQVNINDLATLVQDIDPNTLVTNAGFSTTSGGSYTATLSPNAKNKQFIAQEADIIVIPIYITSPDSSVGVSGGSVVTSITLASSATQTFTANGGYNVGVTTPWSITTHGSSGSTINTSSGLYTAGAAGTDVVTYTDALGNTAIVTITVT